jgi:hypothetical protein
MEMNTKECVPALIPCAALHTIPWKLLTVTTDTACVFAETIRRKEVHAPLKEWLKALRKKCSETGTY